MTEHKHTKRYVLAAWMLAGILLLSGCATVPPQPINGYPTASTAPQAQDDDIRQTQQADLAPPESEAEASASPVAEVTIAPAAQAVPPARVELFYSGSASMMGFADASKVTVYENVMDALPACVGLLWPSAQVTYYRYSVDIPKAAMTLGKEEALSSVGNPTFYRDTELTHLPARLKRADMPLDLEGAAMNEPVRSFFGNVGTQMPTPASAMAGTPVAVTAVDEDDDVLTVIVTDLHELRMDDGALLTALNEKCLQRGKAVGLAAIRSEFAGYIPDIGPNQTAYIWGDGPTGTLDYQLDYGDYTVGISIDPEQRTLALRPFYLLVIGGQDVVNAYLEALEDRLARELSDSEAFRFETAAYGSGYVPDGYTLAGNMRFLSGQGVTAIAQADAPAGVALVELKASQQARFLQWEVTYPPAAADPRGVSLTAEDFTFIAEAVSGEERTVLPNLTWSVVSAEGGMITLALRLDLPAGILPQGTYTLELMGSLDAPPVMPGAQWLADFGYDPDGTQLFAMEQNTAAFDGSRTMYLSRLIDTLGKANLSRLGVAPLGAVQIALTVYA